MLDADVVGWTFIEGTWHVGRLDPGIIARDSSCDARLMACPLPVREGYRWVQYTQSASAGLSGSMMMALRTTGLVEVVDPVPWVVGTDWAIQLPTTAEGIAQLLEAAQALDKLRRDRVGWTP